MKFKEINWFFPDGSVSPWQGWMSVSNLRRQIQYLSYFLPSFQIQTSALSSPRSTGGFHPVLLDEWLLSGLLTTSIAKSSGQHPSPFFTTSCQHKAIGNPLWLSFPKWLLSCGKFSSCLPESFFLVSFDGTSSFAQPINAPSFNHWPFSSLLSWHSCPRGFHSNPSFISI